MFNCGAFPGIILFYVWSCHVRADGVRAPGLRRLFAALSNNERSAIYYNICETANLQRVWNATLPFPRLCSRSCPPTQPSPRDPHSAPRGKKVQHMGLHYCKSNAVLPSVFFFFNFTFIYSALKDEMRRWWAESKRQLHGSCDPSHPLFVEHEFKDCIKVNVLTLM